MIKIGAVLVLAASCLALGCSSSPPPPERAYYLLRSAPAAALPMAGPEATVGIARVDVAPYLDRAGVVIGLGPYEVQEARFHLWAEPLADGVRAYLEDAVSARLGHVLGGGLAAPLTWQRRVDVEVRELHGDTSGTVRLRAGFTVTDAAAGVLAVEQVVATVEQSGVGYPALIAAHVALLDQLADAIARALR